MSQGKDYDRTFTVVVHAASEGGYWAEVPELPGCGSQGETLEELFENIIDARDGVITVMLEDAPPSSSLFRPPSRVQ